MAGTNALVGIEQGAKRGHVASGGSFDVESGGEIDIESGGALKIAGTDTITGVTAGTVTASKVVVVDASKDITGFRQITCSVNGTVGIALTGTYTATAIQLGTSSTALTLTAHDDHIIDIYSTCGSTDGSNTVRPIYMKSIMTGAGGVGGRAEFHLLISAALGGWSNAGKFFAEYGASGRTAGMGSALCAELQLSAGTTSGTYAPLEIEMVVPSGASLGTASSMIYLNATGDDAATFDTGGNLFEIGAGITPAAGKFVSADSQTIRCKVEANTRYLVLSQSENGLGIGVSGTAVSFAQGSPLISLYSTCADTSGSSVESMYVETTMTGEGGTGGRARFYMTTNVTLGGWSNAFKTEVEYGASGRTAGLGSSLCAEMTMSAGTTSGTYAPIEIEIKAPAACSTGTATSFIYVNGEDGSGLLNDNGYLLNIGSIFTSEAAHMWYAHQAAFPANMEGTLRFLLPGGIPAYFPYLLAPV